jgi:hypothetical protein
VSLTALAQDFVHVLTFMAARGLSRDSRLAGAETPLPKIKDSWISLAKAVQIVWLFAAMTLAVARQLALTISCLRINRVCIWAFRHSHGSSAGDELEFDEI